MRKKKRKYKVDNFEEEAWQPIHVNQDYYLLDGQHRLRLAFRTGMKYIDVIMEKKKDPEESKRVRAEIKRKEREEGLYKQILRGFNKQQVL